MRTSERALPSSERCHCTHVQSSRSVARPLCLPSLPGDHAFAGCVHIATLYLHEGLQSIGKFAFNGCIALKSLRLPKGLPAVGSGAFKGCTSIAFVHFNEDLQAIKTSAFAQCTSIRTLRLPRGLQIAELYAFADCSGISLLHLPEGLALISHETFSGMAAFAGCTNIEHVQFPRGLKQIGAKAFLHLVGVRLSVRLPKGLLQIGSMAFAGCADIRDLHLPDGLETIGFGAFQHCSGITAVVLPAAPRNPLATAGLKLEGAFAGCTSLAHVLAPDDLVDPATVFTGCPVLTTGGPTPFSAAKLPRRRHLFWHPTTHAAWCTDAAKACVLAVLVAERRVDAQAEELLPSLAHELWLLILEFVPRHELGPVPV